MTEKQYLGGFEELVLLAVSRLGQNAYGVKIREEIEIRSGRSTSIGAVYTTLERLEEKGFVRSWQGEPTAERGGRAKRYFALEGAAVRALNEADRMRTALQPKLDLGLGGIT